MSSVTRFSKSTRVQQSRSPPGVTRTEETTTTTEIKKSGGGITRTEERTVKISSGNGSSKGSAQGRLGKLQITDEEKDLNDNVFEEENETKKNNKAEGKPERSKRPQASSMSIEKRMAERRQQKAAEQKKKAQGRNAFKQQLEANAPKGEKGSKPKFMTNADSNINKLLLWTQRRTSVYPGVNVTDFGFSWSDGLAFCALLHSLCPNDFPLDQMREDDKRKNLTVAFKFASEQGVPALLDVEEMMSTETPDSKSIITYVHCIYKALVHDRKLSTTVIGSISSTGSTTSTSSISEE